MNSRYRYLPCIWATGCELILGSELRPEFRGSYVFLADQKELGALDAPEGMPGGGVYKGPNGEPFQLVAYREPLL